VILGYVELEELRDLTSDPSWSKLANKLVRYVIEEGEKEVIFFLQGTGKPKTHTADNVWKIARIIPVKKHP
jgi:hypothetical protein